MSTTGHENEAINVQGLKASLQKFKDEYTTDVAYLEEGESSAVIADFDPQTDTVWKKAQTLSNAEKSQVKTNLGLPQEIYSKTEVNNLITTPNQQYVTVATYASLPSTGSADTIYRVSNYNGSTNQVDATMYSEYAWNGTAYEFLCVKSQIGEVFDITAYNSNTKYADLSAALGTNGVNIPESLRKGGMSVKFVQNSDNKYVQYRLMKNTFSTTESDWQGVVDKSAALRKDLITSGGVAQGLSDIERKNTRDFFMLNIVEEWSDFGKYINIGDVGSTVDIDNPSISNDPWRYAVVNCQEGDGFIINGEGGFAPRLYAFVDSNNIIKSRYSGVGIVNNLRITAPLGASKLIINSKIDKACYIGLCKNDYFRANANGYSLKSNIVYDDINYRITFKKEGIALFYQGFLIDLVGTNDKTIDISDSGFFAVFIDSAYVGKTGINWDNVNVIITSSGSSSILTNSTNILLGCWYNGKLISAGLNIFDRPITEKPVEKLQEMIYDDFSNIRKPDRIIPSCRLASSSLIDFTGADAELYALHKGDNVKITSKVGLTSNYQVIAVSSKKLNDIQVGTTVAVIYQAPSDGTQIDFEYLATKDVTLVVISFDLRFITVQDNLHFVEARKDGYNDILTYRKGVISTSGIYNKSAAHVITSDAFLYSKNLPINFKAPIDKTGTYKYLMQIGFFNSSMTFIARTLRSEYGDFVFSSGNGNIYQNAKYFYVSIIKFNQNGTEVAWEEGEYETLVPASYYQDYLSDAFTPNQGNVYDALVKDWFHRRFNDGWVVSEQSYLGAEAGSIDFDDSGNIFIGALCNKYNPQEGGNPVLITFNLHNPDEFENYDIVERNAEMGDFGNVGNNPYDGVVKLLRGTNTCKCIWKNLSESNPAVGVRNFYTNTKTFEEGARYLKIKCPVIVNDSWDGESFEVVDFIDANMASVRNAFHVAYGMELFTNTSTSSSEPLQFNCSIEYDGTYYYASVSFGQGTHPILRSSDMETWEFLTDIPLGYAQDETPIFYYDGYLYSMSRLNVRINRYDITNNIWDKELVLGVVSPGRSATRAGIAVYDGYVYGICNAVMNPDININGVDKTLIRGCTLMVRCSLDLEEPRYRTWISDIEGNYYVLGVHGTSLYTTCGIDRRCINESNVGGRRGDVVFNRVGYYIKDMFE